MSGNKHWAGEQEFLTALQELVGHKTVPLNLVKNCVTIANKHKQDFKMIVYEVEKYIKKSNPEDKIAGLYILDSLSKQHTKESVLFSNRFALRLNETIQWFQKSSTKDKDIVTRLIQEWNKKKIFSPEVLSSIQWHHGNEPASTSAAASIADESFDESGITAHSSSSKKSGSAASKKRPLEKDAKLAPKEVKKAVKLCPFSQSNCPYGDKCRFNHFENNTLEQYAARLLCKPTTTIVGNQPTDIDESVLNYLMDSSTECVGIDSILEKHHIPLTDLKMIEKLKNKIEVPKFTPQQDFEITQGNDLMTIKKTQPRHFERKPVVIDQLPVNLPAPPKVFEIKQNDLFDIFVPNPFK